MDLVEIYKIIPNLTSSRPAEIERVNKFLMSLSQTHDLFLYQDFFKQIPSNWTTLSVDKQFAFNNPGMYHIGDKDSQFLLINTGITGEKIYLLGLVFGKKVVPQEMREMSAVLDTALLVDDLMLVLDFPDYKILNWVVTPIESLVGVE